MLIGKVLREKYKMMVMAIWDAVDNYYSLNVDWPFNEGNPKELIQYVQKVICPFETRCKEPKSF